MIKRLALVGIVVALMLMGLSQLEAVRVQAEEGTTKTVNVRLINQKGKQVGQAVLTQYAKGVQIQLHVSGLTPGVHGIHFHEKGLCKPPHFKTAGEHLNPYHKEHGLENPKGPHAGDMKNIFVDSDGNAHVTINNPRVTLVKGKKNSLIDENGSALIIHQKADDQKSNPSGNSGDRVVCGTIK